MQPRQSPVRFKAAADRALNAVFWHRCNAMFKVRVIPCLDVKDGRVVKGVNFVNLRDAGDAVEPDRWEIFPHGGRHPTGVDAVDYAREVVSLGAGEILLTSMDRDGTRSGFDIALTRAVADAVPVPVIASGGVGNLDHLVAGIRDGHATAVLAASIFHFGEYTVRQAKEHMAQAGLPMRIDG